MIDWSKTTLEDIKIARAIAYRLKEDLYSEGIKMHFFGRKPVPLLDIEMDLVAAHMTMGLDLKGLYSAKLSDLLHDVFGINRNINHDDGTLQNGFVPRYAKKGGNDHA